jgi:uncharacterized protein (DUF1501 family)
MTSFFNPASDPNLQAFTRRQFLGVGGAGLVMASASMTVPLFVQRSALAMVKPGLSSIPGLPDERVLVVVQLAGGNDGLNMVVPFGDPAYYKARPAIGIARDRVITLASESASQRSDGGGSAQGIGLHPQLSGIKELYDNGLCTVIQGVGYPNPNRSHFKSMDIWHTAEGSGTGNGWLGRYFDNECAGSDASGKPTPEPMAGIAIGREVPLAMQGQLSKPIGFETPDLFRWLGTGVDKNLASVYDDITRRGVADGVDPSSAEGFLSRTALDAQLSSDMIRKAVANKPKIAYPSNDLGRQLAMVSSMIAAGLKTRVYYVTLGGFDTHAGQGGENGRHAQLMQQFGSSIAAFYADLKAQGNDQRVMTLSFSEFGRRVAQNASGGTDHGAAAPMILFGPMVRPGIIGRHPSLTDLDAGDLKHAIDFRSVYTGILAGWLKADAGKVLGQRFEAVKVLKA